jgi:hypothetical protein
MNAEPLKKISVVLEAGAAPGQLGLRVPEAELNFVFGIGSRGLTPFEFLLAGRGVGETVHFSLAAGEPAAFFEHLAPPLKPLFEGRREVHFQAKIERIEPADGRTVVKAMAESLAHGGGGCGCGCGCG